jgi:hypothetical protein
MRQHRFHASVLTDGYRKHLRSDRNLKLKAKEMGRKMERATRERRER